MLCRHLLDLFFGGNRRCRTDEQAGAKSKVLLDQVILPLLDGLKMYRAKGVRSYTAPGEVVLDSVVLTAEPGRDESEIR